MATDLGKTKAARITAGAKNDAFVEAQLSQVARRIRLLDVGAALLGFAALVCVFVTAAALCEHAWSLPPWVRQVSLIAFLVGGAVYLYFTLAWPLLHRINPYYAAQAVEQSMPGAKNSVVNWLDVQQQNLSPAIRAAVGQKAAKDLSKTDIDRAFSARRVFWTAGLAALGAIILVGCWVRVGSGSVFNVIMPFSFAGAEARTRIVLVKPANGDDTVTMGQAVTIAARIEGKIPDANSPGAVKVLYRLQQGDPYKSAHLSRLDGEFTAIIQPIDVGDGFWYKVTAGDVETPEYRITVRSRPLLTRVDATYHFRPYVGRVDELHFGKIPFKMEALRGTEITLNVRTNRPVATATLVFTDAPKDERPPVVTKDPDNLYAFKAKFTVERSTHYRLEFTTADGESYSDPNPPDLIAITDNPPKPVELTAPAHDPQLPCNGLLQIEGTASDDIGVQKMTLRLREVTQKFELKGKAYRNDEELRLPGGGYALTLAYKDFIDLNTVETLDGKLLALQKDMELEYWLEAADACDYPKANPVGESKHYHVKLLAPQKDRNKLKNQRDEARREQQQHEANQDAALRKEAQKRLVDEQRRKEDAQREHDATEDKATAKENQGEKNSAAQTQRDKENSDRAEALKKALEDKNRGEAKSNPKPGPDQSPSQEKNGEGEKKPQPGKSKLEGQPEHRQDAGENKPAGQPSDPKNAPGESKPEGKQDPTQRPSENKADPTPRDGPPRSEPKELEEPKQAPRAASKGAPEPQQKKEAGENKPDSKPNDQECTRGDCKNNSKTINPDSKNATPKATPSQAPNAAEGKNDGPNNHGDDPKAQHKDGADPSSGNSKPAPPPELEDNAAPSEAKKAPPSGNGGGDPRKATAGDAKREGEKLKSNDPLEREEARQNLEEIAKDAQDEQARDQALEELEEAGVKPVQPGKGKGKPKTGPAGQVKKMIDRPEDLGKSKDAQGKPEERSTAKDMGKAPIKDQLPELNTPMEKAKLEELREEYIKKFEENLQREGKMEELKDWKEFVKQHKAELNPPQLSRPKAGGMELGQSGGPPPNESPEIEDRDKRPDPATMLQLRKFLNAVDKKVLQDAGITEEQWQQFLKDYANQVVRNEANKETLPAPKNEGKLGSTGGQRDNPDTKADPNTPSGPGTSKAPPGYRDGWKKFTRDLNSPDDKK